MKTVTLQEAYDILNDYDLILLVDGYTVNYPSTFPALSPPLFGKEHREPFLYFYVNTAYYMEFFYDKNQNVKIDGSIMYLLDDEGDEVAISILDKRNLE